MEIEWDEAKRLLVLEKYRIYFAKALLIFSLPHIILPGRSEIEARQKAVAPLGPKVICVVFTIRDDKIRIITARVARKNEREKYQELYAGADQGDEGSDQLGSSW